MNTLIFPCDPSGFEDFAGWLASEKFDGICAGWDGALWTKNGKRLNAPQWFLDAMPDGIRLQGELWCGRGRFTDVLRQTKGDWRDVYFRAFDVPEMPGPFSERMAMLPTTERCIPAEFWTVRSTSHAHDEARRIFRDGGEGIVVRNPGAQWRSGRSQDAIRIKPTKTDEATVKTVSKDRMIADWKGIEIALATHGKTWRVGKAITFEYKGVFGSGQPREARPLWHRDYE